MVAPGLYESDDSWKLDYYAEKYEDASFYMVVPSGLSVVSNSDFELTDIVTIQQISQMHDNVIIMYRHAVGAMEFVIAPELNIVHKGIVKKDDYSDLYN